MNYELMLVVSPKSEVDPIVAKVEKSLKDTSATAVKIEKLGKKTLSYPIARQNEGEYVVVNFEAGGEAVGAISKILRLEQEAILRYLIIKAPKIAKVTKVIKESKEPEGSKGTKAKVTGKVVVKTVTKTATKVTKGPKEPKGSKGTKVKGKKG